MKLRDLRAIIAEEPTENDDLEVTVWIDGGSQRVALYGEALLMYRDDLTLEGVLTDVPQDQRCLVAHCGRVKLRGGDHCERCQQSIDLHERRIEATR